LPEIGSLLRFDGKIPVEKLVQDLIAGAFCLSLSDWKRSKAMNEKSGINLRVVVIKA